VPEPLNYTPVLPPAMAPTPACQEARPCSTAAKRPVSYAGQGVHYAKAWPQ